MGDPQLLARLARYEAFIREFPGDGCRRQVAGKPLGFAARLLGIPPHSAGCVGCRAQRLLLGDRPPLEPEQRPLVPRPPVPTTGTGDAVVDGWLLAWAGERRLLERYERALSEIRRPGYGPGSSDPTEWARYWESTTQRLRDEASSALEARDG